MMNKQILTNKGELVVIRGEFDDTSGAQVHLAKTMTWSLGVNAAGELLHVGCVKMPNLISYTNAYQQWCPAKDAYFDFKREDELVSKAGLACGGTAGVPSEITLIARVCSLQDLHDVLADN